MYTCYKHNWISHTQNCPECTTSTGLSGPYDMSIVGIRGSDYKKLIDENTQLKEKLKIAIEGLKAGVNRTECRDYECCGSCGPIYGCEDALEKIGEVSNG